MTRPPSAASLAASFAHVGYAVVPRAVAPEAVDALLTAVAPAADAGVRGGVRHLLRDVPAVRDLARDPAVRGVAEAALGPGAFAVRGILFDKTPDANWKVAWHQDLAIAVREKRDTPGFGPWSEKAGVAHVQPPAAVLERMLTVRVHLDDCGPENGPVHVIPGSHRHGRLDAEASGRLRESTTAVPTCTGAGGALLMRPLLLHASSPSTTPAHRRVIHIEFAADDLPGGLEWHDRRRG